MDKLSKWARKWIVVGILVLGLVLFFQTRARVYPLPNDPFLGEKMRDAVREDGTLVMEDATDFDWDMVVLFASEEANMQSFGAHYNFKMPDYTTGRLEHWVIFMKAGKPVCGYRGSSLNHTVRYRVISGDAHAFGHEKHRYTTGDRPIFLREHAVFDVTVSENAIVLYALNPPDNKSLRVE